MDTGVLMVGIVIIAISALPFIYIIRTRQQREKQLLQKLHKAATDLHLEMGQYDIWGRGAIGMSTNQTHLISTYQQKEKNETVTVALEQFKGCKLQHGTAFVTEQGRSVKVTQQIRLEFIPKEKANTDNPVIMELYNADNGVLTISDELELANKWTDIANTQIKVLSKQ